MKVVQTLPALIAMCLSLVVSSHAVAAPATVARPSITIVSPHNGIVVHGTSVTVHVAVHNFTLVPPVYLNPPLLSGNRGHIHYYLDNLRNFVATRDASTAVAYTFPDLSPGPHTVFAYLATSQHARFPGTQPAMLHFTVRRGAGSAASHPELAVMGVQSQSTPHGTTVVVHAAVQHFQLVPPIYKNPPLLSGSRGHIHYVLDDISNFQATRDAVTATSHPWTNVAPGPHTILVYLATSQHKQFPGTPIDRIQINVAGVPGKSSSIQVAANLPKTGGAQQSPSPVVDARLLLAATLAIIVGVSAGAIRRRRLHA